jgi:hypothetical protein
MNEPMMYCESEDLKHEMPVFKKIYERLNSAIDVSEKVANQTKTKLSLIRTGFVENQPQPQPISECFVDDILNLLSRLEDINSVSEANLRHLETII